MNTMKGETSWSYDEVDYLVEYDLTPGEKPRLYGPLESRHPGSADELSITDIWVDAGRAGRLSIKDPKLKRELMDIAEKDDNLIDQITQEEQAAEEAAYEDEMERRAEERRDERGTWRN